MVEALLPARPGRARRRLAAWIAVVVVCSSLAVVRSAAPAAAAVPPGFLELTAYSGLVNPTAVRFAPDGRVFVAEKRGTIQMFTGPGDTAPDMVADLSTEVHNFWDRGLLGLAIDPGFTTGRPYLYALYTFDGPVGGSAPRWGTPGVYGDPCPSPPGPTSDGCVVSGKLVKLTLTGTSTTKQDLIHDWCQQYPSHSVGDIVFGGDGALYVSGGDGASFDFVDYGQDGNPLNPCGDPPGGPGSVLTSPTAQGGALRAQDLRTAGDAVSLDGTVIRVSPDSGDPLPDNPAIGASTVNERRIVAYGLRNPFRMTTRPGTNEVWLGDVGWGTYEEVNRLAAPAAGVLNFGWPCYEGNAPQSGYDPANLDICENLYKQPAAHTPPYYPYRHGQPLNSSDNCNVTRGSSTSGVSFSFYSGGPYPDEYDGALFFSDYSRNCIWSMTKGTDGLPDRLRARPFVSNAAGPVDLELSPQGELHYADFTGGTIRRIAYGSPGPTTCPAGLYLAEYFPNKTLTGSPASSVCENAPLNHDWGTGAPSGVGPDNFSARWSGTFQFPTASTYTFTAVSDDGIRVWVDDDLVIDQWRDQSATTFTAARSLTAGSHRVKVEWFESGVDAVAKFSWTGGGSPPAPTITSPAAGTTWQVGETINFSGSATDNEDGALAASRLSWEMVLQHCPSACHAHPLQSWVGVSGASIAGPDHEYPSHLELRLTATDSSGQRATATRRLDPRTVDLTLASQPAGLQLTLGQRTAPAPFTTRVIVGSTNSLTAPTPQSMGGSSYTFSGWSDGGTASHNVTASTAVTTYTATFTATPGCAAGQYTASYFANRTWSGTPASTGCQAFPLDQSWGSGGPAGAGVDNFSARYSGTFTFPGGNRTFTASADDAVRVYLDGVRIIDRNSPGTSSVTRSVPAGPHVVRVDYFERTKGAFVRVSW